MAVTDTQIQRDDDADRPASLADQIAAEFEKRQASSIGSGEGESESLAAGAETEPEATNPHVNGDGEDGAGSGGEVTATTTTPPSNDDEEDQQENQGENQGGIPDHLPLSEPPMPQSFSMDEYAAQIYGRPLTQEETAQLFAWQQQFSQLDSEKLTAIDGIIRGQIPASVPNSDPDDDSADPYIQQQIQQALAPIQQQLGQVSQFVETEAQRQARMESERVASQITAGTQGFKEHYGLSDEDIADLEQRVVRSQTFPGLFNAFQGDGKQAMSTALEQVLWATPEYRDRMIEAQVQSAQNQAQADATRKRKASALSGGGGSVSRDTPPPASTQGRQAAMAAELAEHMNGSGTQ